MTISNMDQVAPETYTAIHTDKLRGHKHNDLIIIYSKLNELFPHNTNIQASELFVPQWFGTDYVNIRRGVSVPLDKPIGCTFEQMATLGKQTMNRKVKGGVDRVLFYHTDTILSICGMRPFNL